MCNNEILLEVIVTERMEDVETKPISKLEWEECKLTYSPKRIMLKIRVSKNMNEIQLKQYLCNKGFIPAKYDDFIKSKLYFSVGFDSEFIEIAESGSANKRSLAELGVNEGSILVVKSQRCQWLPKGA